MTQWTLGVLSDLLTLLAGVAPARICQDGPRDGPRAYDCAGDVPLDAVPTGKPMYLRMVYAMPRGNEADTTVHCLRAGTARDTDTVSISGSIHYRT